MKGVRDIPFEIESDGNLLINSDFDGVCRILRQLMDNAIKYGNGAGIGLFESRQIARKLGGDIIMRSGNDVTEVTVFLPKS